ncbi:PRADC1-like protein [Prorops nasuta]|uniref:PRADC1-like protein n=1 Tax=Prorops nasuta TaxID=863751 RepID=UPI0034CF1736
MYKTKLTWLLNALVLCASGISTGCGEDYKIYDLDDHTDKFLEADIFFEITDPPELKYTYRLKPTQDFGVPFNQSLAEREIELVPIIPSNGCEKIVNAELLKGKVALIERGKCSFFVKSLTAEEAGAKAVIISDYPISSEEDTTSPIWLDYYYVEMSHDDTVPSSKSVNIPAGFLLGKNGRMIRETLKKLNRSFALINIPLNFTNLPQAKLHQPPWHLW